MCRATFLVVVIFFIKYSRGEDYTQAFLYTKPYRAVPTPTDFNDIFSNSVATEITDDSGSYRGHLTPSTRYVDLQYATESPRPLTTLQPPKTDLNTSSTMFTPSTPKKHIAKIQIVNIRKRKEESPQKGILDLLFPEQRVRSFKTFFDAFKQLLSHTL